MEEHRDPGLGRAWPLFGLAAAHGDLLLREATDEDVVALAQVVEGGVVEAGNEHFLPRLLHGRAATADERVADFLRFHWGRRAATTPEKWALGFAVLLDGEVVGTQGVHTSGFPARREVATGSYLARAAQGRGVGTRMRSMVLELSFACFGARWATSGYTEGNEPSRRLSARLGYEPDGIELIEIPGAGRAVESHRLRLSRRRWSETRPAWLDEVRWSGVEAARTLLGI